MQFPPKLLAELKQKFPKPSQIQALTWPLALHGKAEGGPFKAK